ncbi:MAG: hypothetical protein WCK32_03220 [Chlorobiaceae bacterium]
MTKNISASLIINMLLAITFIGLALYLLICPSNVTSAAKENLNLYALLSAAYGTWKLMRVYLAWNLKRSHILTMKTMS